MPLKLFQLPVNQRSSWDMLFQSLDTSFYFLFESCPIDCEFQGRELPGLYSLLTVV